MSFLLAFRFAILSCITLSKEKKAVDCNKTGTVLKMFERDRLLKYEQAYSYNSKKYYRGRTLVSFEQQLI